MSSPPAPWCDAPPPSDRLAACVIVPVRNEADRLTSTLSALAAQQASPSQPFDRRRYEVLLLANNCDDASAAVARDFASRHPALALHIAEVRLPPALAHIGHVRRLLMDAAAARLAAAGPAGVIASTDGDTVVAPDWLARTLHDIGAGADAVGGRIVIDARDDTDALLRRRRRCDSAYRLACERLASQIDPQPEDPWPRHHQHFCGSLALTRAAYLQVGGLPEVSYLEDEALVSALRAHDLRLRHSPLVRVTTSGRQVGRAEVGLAWQLRQWAEGTAQAHGLMVEGAPTLVARFKARRQLRGLWRRRQGPAAGDLAQAHRLAPRWHLAGQRLAERVVAAPTFGQLWAGLEASLQEADPPPLVPVREALDGLRASILETAALQPLEAAVDGAADAAATSLRSNRSSR